MALGNPAQDRAVSEVCRLLGVGVDLARGILTSVPIVIFADLDQRTAATLTKRLLPLVELGAQIATTTKIADDLPCMNWPELPPIAREEDDGAPRAEAPAPHPPAGLSCPSCGTGLKLVPEDGTPRRRAPRSDPGPAAMPSVTEPEEDDEDEGDDWMATPRSMGPAPERPRPQNPPSTRRKSTRFDNPALLNKAGAPPAGAAGEARAQSSATAVEEPAPAADDLRVQLSQSSIEELTGFAEEEAESAVSGDVGWDSGDDLADLDVEGEKALSVEPDDLGFSDEDDGFDLDPIRGPDSEDDLDPIRGPASEDDLQPLASPAPAPLAKSNGFDDSDDGLGGFSDMDSSELIQDSTSDAGGIPGSTSDVFASRQGRTDGKDPFEDSEDGLGGGFSDSGGLSFGDSEDLGAGLEDSGSDLLDQTPPHRMHDTPSSRFRSDLDFLDEPSSPSRAFDDLDELADPPPSRGGKKRGGSSRAASSSIDPSLSDVLETFGPEDDEPLDSLDPSPPSLGKNDSGRRRSPDMSDILEPLDPDEALKIMKSKRVDSGRGSARASTASHLRLDDDPSSLEPLDPAEAKAMLASEPTLEDSDDDLFGDPPPAPKAKSRSAKPGTDPFARTRRRKEEEPSRGRSRRREEEPSRGRSSRREEEPSRGRSGRSSRREEDPSRGRSGRSSRREEDPRRSSKKKESGRSSRKSGDDPRRSGRKRSAGGPPKGGPGKHGLVLSRILDPEKKEVAAELIKEIRGIPIDDARRLTDRTIIPVLKDVTREEAEYHLDTFKDKQIAGRITTRQR